MLFKPFGLFLIQLLVLHISANAVFLQIIMVETFAKINAADVLQLEARGVMLIFSAPILPIVSDAICFDDF